MRDNLETTRSRQALDQFQSENPWLLMADGPTLSAFYARWDRAGSLPGTFYGGGLKGLPEWGYWKGPVEDTEPNYRVSVHSCSCPDATNRAPNGWCKHRLAVWNLDRHLRRLASGIVQSVEEKLEDLYQPTKQDRFPLREAA
ncbi:MAG: hypothetical protein V3S68_04805 [Dehalococcoidia bacterium]